MPILYSGCGKGYTASVQRTGTPHPCLPVSIPPPDLVFRSQHAVVDGVVRPASVWVRGGRIAEVREHGDVPAGVPVVDVGERVLMPGLVDTHVHVNDPGRADWEGWDTATRAAAAGGVTTLVDMPLNSVPETVSVDALRRKVEAAAGRLYVDAGLWGGVVPGNAGELRGLWKAGVLGFKCFMVPSGVDGFAHVGEGDLREAMPILAELGAPLLAHAESPGPIDAAAAALDGADPRSYATYLASRPDEAEIEAIGLLVRLCREYRVRTHVVHLATARALSLLLDAREEGLPLTVETCPHYLHFAAEDVPDGATELKCAPPIRGRANAEELWAALGAGLIDLVATDHSPCPPELKLRDEGDFLRAWGGIASLQVGLSAVWREARQRGYTPADLARWMSAAPARLAGLHARKGAIAPGMDADLVVWSPDAEWLVTPESLHHRHKLSPYVGHILPGVVEETWLRGVKVYDRGEFPSAPAGRLLGVSDD